MTRKNPAAVSLGRKGGRAKVPKGFSTLSAAERRRIALLGVKARKAKRRCPCGAMTEKRAAARGHQCVEVKP